MVTPYIGIGDVGSNPSLTTISYLWLASAGLFCLKQSDSCKIPYHHALLGNVFKAGSQD